MSITSIVSDALPEPWVAHEHPERPLAWGAHLCGCDACGTALRAAAGREPTLPVAMKFVMSRRVITSAKGLASVEWNGEALACYGAEADDDWVRDIYVVRSTRDASAVWEERFLALMREHGLPEPERDVVVRPDGSWSRDLEVRRL